MYLIDTSVIARAGREPVAGRVDQLLGRALISICAITELEAGRSARTPADYAAQESLFGAAFGRVAVEDPMLRRALDVQRALVATSHHRGISLADLTVAACAERAQLTVLHYDADYDRIAQVTGQPVEWVVPRGTAD